MDIFFNCMQAGSWILWLVQFTARSSMQVKIYYNYYYYCYFYIIIIASFLSSSSSSSLFYLVFLRLSWWWRLQGGFTVTVVRNSIPGVLSLCPLPGSWSFGMSMFPERRVREDVRRQLSSHNVPKRNSIHRNNPITLSLHPNTIHIRTLFIIPRRTTVYLC